jgi:hypothetical protein
MRVLFDASLAWVELGKIWRQMLPRIRTDTLTRSKLKCKFWKNVVFLYVALLALTALSCSREELDTSTSENQSRDSVNTNFSSEIVLASYANTEVGGHTFLTLVWHAPYDKPRDAYSVAIHAIDKKGRMLFQFDHKLVNGAGLSTNLWDRELVKDVFQITPPVGHTPGKYTLRIGVWVPNEKWLSIFATNAVEDNDEFFKHRAILLPDIDCR